jgi:hypothetical protein
MADKMLSVEPVIDPTAKLHDARLGTYCEVGARTTLHDVAMGLFCRERRANHGTTIGSSPIAAMTDQPGNHPMQRVCRHATIAPARIFPASDEAGCYVATRPRPGR